MYFHQKSVLSITWGNNRMDGLVREHRKLKGNILGKFQSLIIIHSRPIQPIRPVPDFIPATVRSPGHQESSNSPSGAHFCLEECRRRRNLEVLLDASNSQFGTLEPNMDKHVFRHKMTLIYHLEYFGAYYIVHWGEGCIQTQVLLHWRPWCSPLSLHSLHLSSLVILGSPPVIRPL